MKKIVSCFIFALIFLTCKNNKENKKSQESVVENDTISFKLYSNNSYKELKFKNGLIKIFYVNGNLFTTGYINEKNQKTGYWYYYTKEGQLSEIREHLIIKNMPYVNQQIFFRGDKEVWFRAKDPKFNLYDQKDFQSDTLNYNLSFYTEFEVAKDTIFLNEPWLATAYYYTPVFKDKKSDVIVVLGDFNEDFSNVKEVKRDTFFNLVKDVENQKWFPDDDFNYTLAFGKWFNTSGEKEIRGYVSEYFKDSIKNEHEIRTYFKKRLFVKDSI